MSHLGAILREFPEANVSVLVQSDRDLSRLSQIQDYRNATFINVSEFRPQDYDVLHLPDPMSLMHTSVGRFFEYVGKLPITILFHDLIPIILHDHHFDHFGSELGHNYLSRLEIVRDNVTHVFTNSIATMNDLVRIVGIPREKCEAVYAGTILDTPPLVKGHGTRYGKFFLTVGGLDSHKGFDETLICFTRNFLGKDMELLVVGSKSDGVKDKYAQVLAEAGITSVHFLGFISDQELARLYSEAVALVFPSRYEGFGFPVLEAMACGCPVITRRNSSLEEVGGDVALYIEDDSLEGLMKLLFNDEGLRESLRIKGRQHSAQFTWAGVARQTVARWQSFV
jgi:glycosyltransferase involved in cell wall biosynthesis